MEGREVEGRRKGQTKPQAEAAMGNEGRGVGEPFLGQNCSYSAERSHCTREAEGVGLPALLLQHRGPDSPQAAATGLFLSFLSSSSLTL